MTEQHYTVVADRDKGDRIGPGMTEPYDRVTYVTDGDKALARLVRIERPVTDADRARVVLDASAAQLEAEERPVPTADEPKRVLMTHPHDGHGPDDTCLDCETKSSPHPPTREQIAEDVYARWPVDSKMTDDIADYISTLLQNGADR